MVLIFGGRRAREEHQLAPPPAWQIDTTPTISFSSRSPSDKSSFLVIGSAPRGDHRPHGLRVRRQAELMGITPGTARLTQQTGHARWVAASRPQRSSGLANPAQDRWRSAGGEEESQLEKLEEELEADASEQEGEEAEEEGDQEEDEEEAEEVESKAEAVNGDVRPLRPLPPGPLQPKPRLLQPTIPSSNARATYLQQKRSEGEVRDWGYRAIAQIKHGLRQSGVQSDGRPFVLLDWEKVYKPFLGDYLQFLQSRPDQFQITRGRSPGFWTIENVSGDEVVAAPTWEEALAARGRGRGGKGRGALPSHEGSTKGAGKGKPSTPVKGTGKLWGPRPPLAPPPAHLSAAGKQAQALPPGVLPAGPVLPQKRPSPASEPEPGEEAKEEEAQDEVEEEVDEEIAEQEQQQEPEVEMEQELEQELEEDDTVEVVDPLPWPVSPTVDQEEALASATPWDLLKEDPEPAWKRRGALIRSLLS